MRQRSSCLRQACVAPSVILPSPAIAQEVDDADQPDASSEAWNLSGSNPKIRKRRSPSPSWRRSSSSSTLRRTRSLVSARSSLETWSERHVSPRLGSPRRRSERRRRWARGSDRLCYGTRVTFSVNVCSAFVLFVTVSWTLPSLPGEKRLMRTLLPDELIVIPGAVTESASVVCAASSSR